MSQKMLTLREDLRSAMRSQDVCARETLRMVISACQQRELETNSLTDEDVITILLREKKNRVESLDQYRHAGREDIVLQLQAEIVVIEHYLPKQLTPQEIATRIDQKIATMGSLNVRDIGKVMGVLGAELRGIADLKVVSELVKQRLSGTE